MDVYITDRLNTITRMRDDDEVIVYYEKKSLEEIKEIVSFKGIHLVNMGIDEETTSLLSDLIGVEIPYVDEKGKRWMDFFWNEINRKIVICIEFNEDIPKESKFWTAIPIDPRQLQPRYQINGRNVIW